MASFKSIVGLLLTFTLSAVFGFIPFVLFTVDIFRKGPSRMFFSRPRNDRPEILKTSQYGAHQFVRLPRTRLKLHCVVNGSADKPLMLFLHGFPEFWYSWRHQLKEFWKDYRVVAVDMRGYGDSDKPSGIREYTLDKLVDDVDQLISELGYDKCILVSHDWGGVVAWAYAAVHPQRVERLVICNCPHSVAYQNYITKPKALFSQLLKSWYILFFQLPVLPELTLLADNLANYERVLCSKGMGARRGTFTAEDMEAFKYTFATFGDWSAAINYYRAFRYESPQVDEAVFNGKKISVPTLIIWGAKDGFIDEPLAELSCRLVENCSLQLIEGASHWVQQEEAFQVNRFIRQFLQKQF